MSALLELDAAFDASAVAAAGEPLRVRVRLRNGGCDMERDARMLARADDSLLLISTAPWLRGDASGRELAFVIPPLLRDETCEFVVSAYALRGGDARIAVRLDFEGAVHERELRCTSVEPHAFEGDASRFELFDADADAGAELGGRVVLTNASGAFAVGELRIEGDLEDVRLDCEPVVELAPGTRRVLALRARVPAHKEDGERLEARALVVHRSGTTSLGECAILIRSRARFEGSIEAAVPHGKRVRAGERIEWNLRLTNAGRAAAHTMTVALSPTASVYVPGSTTLDGARLIDVGGSSALWSAEGLMVEGFPAGHTATLTCETLVEPAANIVALSARIRCEERELMLESPVFEAAAEELHRGGLAFSVPGAAFMPVPGMAVYRRSPGAALDSAAIRHLDGMRGFARHLWALGALCADSCDDPAAAPHVGAARAALRSVFDRLSIKLRIPEYQLQPEDVLDAAAVGALAHLIESDSQTLAARLASATTLVAAAGCDAPTDGYREALRRKFASFADDRALIDALTKTDGALDERLRDVVASEAMRRTGSA